MCGPSAATSDGTLAPSTDHPAVCPAADSTGVPDSLKPVPVIASVVAWQPVQSAEPTGMWLPLPAVPTVPGGCTGCPPRPRPLAANGPLPAPWQLVQLSELTAECTM